MICRAKRRHTTPHADKLLSAPAYITRKIPWVEYMEEEGLVRLEEQADRIVQNVGLEFQDDPVALEIWRKAGANVQGSRIRLDAGHARKLCETAPKEFIQHARNPARSVKIGGRNTVFAPVYGPPFVQDLEGGRRYGTLADLERFVKLTYMLPSLHHSGLMTCEPCDEPVNKRHLDALYAHMRWSDKPMLGAITEKSRAEDCVEMARILFGSEFVDQHCVIIGNTNTNSPLLVDRVVSEAVRTYSAAGQGMIVTPFILSGAMGPVTTAASIAQAFAEAMVCCAFSQLVKPGSPFIVGNFHSSMNLRSGAPTFGTPEPVSATYVIGQLVRRLGVPLRCGGAFTSSKLPDAQAGAESADTMHATTMAGANFILHSAGWLEGGLVAGYEKFVMDADRSGGYAKLISGISTDDNALGYNAYEDVEPGGHFLGSAHTMDNYKTANQEFDLSNSDSFEQWEERGSKDSYRYAFERWNMLLETYEPPEVDASKNDALKDFIVRRKRTMPDAWH